jgi:hypothetical protein
VVSQVKHAPKVDSEQILSFYMGKKTPERKGYIMEKPRDGGGVSGQSAKLSRRKSTS